MPEPTFTNCSCPDCKVSLCYCEITETHCPKCKQPLDAAKVWATRKYPGLIEIPPWITAFTWPLALIALGIFVLFYGSIFLGGIAASTGIVFFFFKLSYGRNI